MFARVRGGDRFHAALQAKLAAHIESQGKRWGVRAYISLSVRLKRDWYPIPDVCVYAEPGFEGRYPETPPLLWVEILSHDDRMVDVLAKANELIANAVPYVWIIDPNTLESQLHTADGIMAVPEKTLRLPGSEIVIPLLRVVEE